MRSSMYTSSFVLIRKAHSHMHVQIHACIVYIHIYIHIYTRMSSPEDKVTSETDRQDGTWFPVELDVPGSFRLNFVYIINQVELYLLLC